MQQIQKTDSTGLQRFSFYPQFYLLLNLIAIVSTNFAKFGLVNYNSDTNAGYAL